MSTLRIKNKDGSWSKVPILGSYAALEQAQAAAESAENAKNIAVEKANYTDRIISAGFLLAEDLCVVDGKVCLVFIE